MGSTKRKVYYLLTMSQFKKHNKLQTTIKIFIKRSLFFTAGFLKLHDQVQPISKYKVITFSPSLPGGPGGPSGP